MRFLVEGKIESTFKILKMIKTHTKETKHFMNCINGLTVLGEKLKNG